MAVYHTLSFVDLTPVEGINSTIREIQERRAGSMAMGRLRGQRQQKQQGPAILSVFNKAISRQPPKKQFGYKSRIKKVADKYQGKSPRAVSARKSKMSSRGSYHNEGMVKGEDFPNVTVTEAFDGDIEHDEHALGGQAISATSNMSQAASKVDFKLPSIVE